MCAGANSWIVYGCSQPSSSCKCTELWSPSPPLAIDTEYCGVCLTHAVMLYPRSLRLLYLVLHPISCSLANAQRGKEHEAPTCTVFHSSGPVVY
jgi:hypothetical protein